MKTFWRSSIPVAEECRPLRIRYRKKKRTTCLLICTPSNSQGFTATATWGGPQGGPPGPRSTPSPASASGVMSQPDQGVRGGRGRPPHSEVLDALDRSIGAALFAASLLLVPSSAIRNPPP